MTQEFVPGVTIEEETQLMDREPEPEPEVVEETPEPVVEEKAEEKEEVKEEVKEETPKNKDQEILENLKAALRENREETKALRRQVEIANELKKQIDEMRKPKVEEKPLPSYEEDPLGYSKAKLEQIEAQNKIYAEKQKHLETYTEQNRITQFVTHAENEFKRINPDYDAAFNHLISIQKQQLQLSGVPETMLDEVLADQATKFAHQAVQSGKNPAELVYEYAKLYGYKKATPVVEKTQVDKTVEKLEAVQKGLTNATKTLSKGGKTETPASVEQLLNAKGEEFDKLWNDIFEK